MLTINTEYKSKASAAKDAGNISTRNSKMPGSTFAISPSKCNVGGKLAQVKGSVCDKCYAIKLENMRPSVRQGWAENYMKATRLIENNPLQWARAMAFQINKSAEKTGEYYHRWFDAGDLQSEAMLRAIILVCNLTPNVKHWLPTREARIVKNVMAEQGQYMPDNLIIRISATMVGDKPHGQWAHTSTVHGKSHTYTGHACPARNQGNACGECRACWDKSVANVSYPLH